LARRIAKSSIFFCIAKGRRMNGNNISSHDNLINRQKSFLLFILILLCIFYVLCPDSDTFNSVLLLCFPSFFFIYNIHVEHTHHNAWWTNWAIHKMLALILVFVFGFRLVYGGTQIYDLIGLGLWLYVYHATGDVDL